MAGKTVLLVGLATAAVDFEKWPELSPEKLEKAFREVLEQLRGQGYQPHWCLTGAGPEAVAQLREGLQRHDPDVVLIGAGVRTDPDHFLLFERLINEIHERAPRARIAFNTRPQDSAEAVERWISSPPGSP